MTEPLWTDSEWTFPLINKVYEEIHKIGVGEMGLDPYAAELEIISSEQMLDAYSSIGMPVYYRHWSFGKSFTRNKTMYDHGMQGLAYEIVINSDPCISYLMESNTMTMQALVIAHAAIGHSHFFKNNSTFKYWTDATSIMDYLVFAKEYVAKCEEREGKAEVERFIDSCHALMSYGVNRYKRPSKLSIKREKDRQEGRDEFARIRVNDLFDRLLKTAEKNKEEVFPQEPEENILYFCEKYAPDLPVWKREVIRIVRKLSEYFHPQGLCVVGETYVYTPNGMQMMKDIISKEGYHPFETDVLSNGNKFERTSHALKRKVNKTIRVKTKLGRTIEGTPEHPIQVLLPDMTLPLQRLDQLTAGTRLVVKLGYENAFAKSPAHLSFARKDTSETVMCEICNKEFGNLSTHIPTHGMSVTDYKRDFSGQIISERLLAGRGITLQFPSRMSIRFARLLGYFVAEGHYNDYTWSISNTDRNLIDEVISTLSEEFGLTATVVLSHRGKDLPCWNVSICNSGFREFLSYCGVHAGQHSWDQEIPWVILQSDKETVRNFLATLFEGDGCNTANGRITYASTSLRLIQQVQILLCHFGIISAIRLASDITPHTTWTLPIVSDFYDVFLNEIGFVSSRKNSRKREEVYSSPFSIVPFVKDFVDHIKERIDPTPSKFKDVRREWLPYTSSTEFSRSKIANQKVQFDYVGVVDSSAHNLLKEVIDPSNFYDEIDTIEVINEEKFVYDFTVPSNSLFVSDSFISHNTKTMNEGAATYTHYRIMNRLHEKGLMTDGSMYEFIKSHTNVVFQPDFDDPRYSGMNPYALGFAMMRDIERICKEPTAEDRRWFPQIAGCNDDLGVLKDAWANYRDESFIRQYLSPKLIRNFGLFRVKDSAKEPHLMVTAIHNDTGYEKIRESLADQYEIHNHLPQLEVVRVDPKTRHLNIRYKPYRSRVLANVQIMLKHLEALWGYPVLMKDDKGNELA